MSRVVFWSHAALWLAVLVIAALLAVTDARASAHSRVAWCRGHQLALSNARGPHTDFGEAESTIWFLQILNHGDSACLTGGWLRLFSARALNGDLVKVRDVPGSGLPGSPKTFVLRPRARAFVELEAGFPTTVAASKGCKPRALLTFSLPHDGGLLAVRVPAEADAVCPSDALDVSETVDAAAFRHFMQELNTTSSTVPYVR